MRCEYCPACQLSYEYNEFSCDAGYEDESIEFDDGTWGCRHPANNIEKRINQKYAMLAEIVHAFAENQNRPR